MSPKATVLLALLLSVAPSVRGAETAGRTEPSTTPGGRYNLILISLGNVGTAHMSLYGYPRETTPRLDRWAKDAVVFENAYSPASWTLPVGTSLFTSLYPFAHGVMTRGKRNTLNESIPTLPEILKRAGFATAAFTGGLDYYRGFGHMRGFDTAPDNPDFTGYQTTLPQATQWLSTHDRKRFFLFIHGYDAHCPFAPPAEPFRGSFTRDDPPSGLDTSRCWRGISDSTGTYTADALTRCDLDRNSLECVNPWRLQQHVLKQPDIDHLRNLYDEDVLSVDAQVGKFLDSLSTQTLSQTIVVVYCEHGEMFAKHGRFGRAGSSRGTLYDDVLHVPLLVRLPQPLSGRVRSMVELTDIMPTVLDLLGIPKDPGLKMQGKDLRPLLEGKDGPVHDRVYAGSAFGFGRYFGYSHPLTSSAVRDTEWKLISEENIPKEFLKLSDEEIKDVLKKHGEPKPRTVETLYQVSRDPEERIDLARKRPDVVARLREDLRRWREQCQALLSARAPSTKPVPDSLLRSAQERGYW